MRRKTDNDVVKENMGCLLLSVFFIVIGIFVACRLLVFPPVENDSLQTKEVTVQAFKHHNGGYRGASYDYIRTVDGEKFNISGEYERERLEELLTEGRVVTIKWYKNKPFMTMLAEEMYVDGERIVTYDNDEPISWVPGLFLGIVTAVVGIFGLLWCNFILKKTGRDRRNVMKESYENMANYEISSDF